MIEFTREMLEDDSKKYVRSIIDGSSPSLDICNCSRVFAMLAVFNDTTFSNDIETAYENCEMEYYKAYVEGVTPSEKIHINALLLGEHDAVTKLLGMYIRCRETKDFTPFNPILRRRFKKLYNYIMTTDAKFVTTGDVARMHKFKFSHGEAIDSTMLAVIAELLAYMKGVVLISDNIRVEALNFLSNQYLVGRIYIEVLSDEDTNIIEHDDSFGLDVEDGDDLACENKIARINSILNPKNVKLDTWISLLEQCYPSGDEVDSRTMTEYFKWHSLGINCGFSTIDIFYRQFDKKLYNSIVYKLASTYRSLVPVDEDIKILFFSVLVIVELRKRIHELSAKCYTDLERKSDLNCFELEQQLKVQAEELRIEKLEFSTQKSSLERTVSTLQDEVKKQDQQLRTIAKDLESYSTDRYELEMYRRHNYVVSCDESTVDLETKIMKCNGNFVIIGGNPDWQRKLSEALTEVDFYDIKDFSRYRNSLKKYDKIFINVTYTGHSIYWKLIDHLSYLNLNSEYLSGYPNLARCIDEMYKTVEVVR